MKRLGRKGKGLLFGTLAFLCVSGILLAALLWNGVILLNRPSEAQYPVRGVDVSAYQGSIDWAVLASQGISFAFLKATEGSSMTDRCFAYNYEQAWEQSLRVGAYHFFSFDSPGRTQAELFIATVAPYEGMLPPVIDKGRFRRKASFLRPFACFCML